MPGREMQVVRGEGDRRDIAAAPTKTKLDVEPGQTNHISYTPYLKYLCENES